MQGSGSPWLDGAASSVDPSIGECRDAAESARLPRTTRDGRYGCPRAIVATLATCRSKCATASMVPVRSRRGSGPTSAQLRESQRMQITRLCGDVDHPKSADSAILEAWLGLDTRLSRSAWRMSTAAMTSRPRFSGFLTPETPTAGNLSSLTPRSPNRARDYLYFDASGRQHGPSESTAPLTARPL